MTKVKVYNIEGKEVGDKELNPNIFDIQPNQELVSRAVVAHLANVRQVLAHTKDRSEVRGGGRKPWRQKGTGRARHGSTRSPIWIGGGVTFGPTKERNFYKKINKKAKRKALFMVLTDKVTNNNVVLVDKLEFSEIKTKKMVEIIKKLPVEKKILLVLPEKNENIVKSTKNIKEVKTIGADSLNIVDLLNNNFIVAPVDSLQKIEATYLK